MHGQVQVAVSAVGLNFRDVLNVLGMYPGDPGMPGETSIYCAKLADLMLKLASDGCMFCIGKVHFWMR